jgi:hypothetical protein
MRLICNLEFERILRDFLLLAQVRQAACTLKMRRGATAFISARTS